MTREKKCLKRLSKGEKQQEEVEKHCLGKPTEIMENAYPKGEMIQERIINYIQIFLYVI